MERAAIESSIVNRAVYGALGNRGYRWLLHRLQRVPVEDTETGFKLFVRERILPVLDRCQDTGWFWDTEVVVRASEAGLRCVEVPALFLRRLDKQSTVRPVRDTLEYFSRLRQFRRRQREERRPS